MKNKIEDLRDHLFETIEMLKDNDEKVTGMTVEKAKVISHVAGKIIESAKVEVEFIKAVSDMGTREVPTTGFMQSKQLNA